MPLKTIINPTNVSAVIKKYTDVDISNHDVHIQFLQTYEGIEGDSGSIAVATAVFSALTNIPVKQEVAMTGSLSVRGEVLPIGGATFKTEAAIEAGIKTVIVPLGNLNDIVLDDESRKKINIVPVIRFHEVLETALVGDDSGIIERFKVGITEFERDIEQKLKAKVVKESRKSN